MKVCICSFCAVLCFSLSLFFLVYFFSRFAADRSPLGLKHLHRAEKSLPLGLLVAQRGCTQEVSGMWVAVEGPVSSPQRSVLDALAPFRNADKAHPRPPMSLLPLSRSPARLCKLFPSPPPPNTHVPAPTPFLSIRSTAGSEGGCSPKPRVSPGLVWGGLASEKPLLLLLRPRLPSPSSGFSAASLDQ